MAEDNVHIVGGGLVGTLACIYLAKRGIKVTLHEQRADMRKSQNKGGGRSINLALTSRGLKALAGVGLAEKAMEIMVPMKGRSMHSVAGETSFSPYSNKPGETNNSISRGGLNELLLNEAENAGVEILFDQHCTGYDADTSTLTFETPDGTKTVPADVVIGADGGGSTSVMHKALDERMPGNYSRERLNYKYKELSFPAGENGAYQMDEHALHIWSRNSEYMLIALPNTDGSFTGTLFLRDESEVNFDTLTGDNVSEFFGEHFPDALQMMPNLESDFRNNPVGEMHTVKCRSWHLGGKLMLIGDAAHAVVPFHGQGMNGGFEDCAALGDMVDRHTKDGSVDWNNVFTDLEADRKHNTDALAIMSLENLKDMLSTADAPAVLRRNIGFRLAEMSEQEAELQDRFLPHYTMITFRPNISYAQVRERDLIQAEILDTLAGEVEPADAQDWDAQVDWDEDRRLVCERLSPIASGPSLTP